MTSRKRGFRALALGLVAVAGLALTPAAFARDHFSLGINLPGLSVGVGPHHSYVGVGGYYAPAYPAYYGPTYYAPAPVYYDGPAYYGPAYYGPAVDVVYTGGGYYRGYRGGHYYGGGRYYGHGGYYGGHSGYGHGGGYYHH